jgi:hypothetical protein
MKKSLVYSVTLLMTILVSCLTPHYGIKEYDVAESMPLAEIGDLNTESAAVDIQSAEIKGTSIKLVVSYSGGCAEHRFRLIGSPILTKSLPPQRSVKLIHTNNGDQCKKMITDTILFDITPLANNASKDKTVVLNLDGVVTLKPLLLEF